MVDQLTKRSWEIAEELGSPVPEYLKLYESLCDELRECSYPEQYLPVADLAANWIKSRNPYYMDAAILLWSSFEKPITSTLQHEQVAVSKLRWEGDPRGTADKVKKQQIRGAALMIMANLCHAGLSVPQAAKVAENIVNGKFKYTSLAKFYNKEIKPEREAKLYSSWEKHTPNHRDIWLNVVKRVSTKYWLEVIKKK